MTIRASSARRSSHLPCHAAVSTESAHPEARPGGYATGCAVAKRWPLLRPSGPTAVLFAGRFETRRQIGAGGLAEVFAARDRATGSDVAVKVLHPHLARDPRVRERFRRELAIARSLEHPGVVRVFDVHEHRGRPLI